MNENGSDPAPGIPEAIPAGVRDFLVACGVPQEVVRTPETMLRLYRDLSLHGSTINLTRIESLERFWVLHVADSLAIGRVVPHVFRGPQRVADVGSGAGFPLFPLTWANPELRATAVETRKRRVRFLEEEAVRLGLSGRVTVVHRQAREVGRLPEHAGAYDLVTARAVGSAGRLIRDCRQMLRPGGGLLVLYKTPSSVQEEREEARREARKYGLRLRVGRPFELPDGGGLRTFMVAERP